jgi:hypothetical protein
MYGCRNEPLRRHRGRRHAEGAHHSRGLIRECVSHRGAEGGRGPCALGPWSSSDFSFEVLRSWYRVWTSDIGFYWLLAQQEPCTRDRKAADTTLVQVGGHQRPW